MRACDAEVTALTAFADHHPYSAADARALIAAARATDAELVTTAKDWVRCPPDLRAASAVLEIDLTYVKKEFLGRCIDAMDLYNSGFFGGNRCKFREELAFPNHSNGIPP